MEGMTEFQKESIKIEKVKINLEIAKLASIPQKNGKGFVDRFVEIHNKVWKD